MSTEIRRKHLMPRYEMMYILASSVSDDQLPAVAGEIVQLVTDFGGTDIQETQLGKKKLAYPIKKTRNGFYGVIEFTMDTKKVNTFDAKIRTQNNIIRYLIVNLDEHLERLAKDREVQAKMNRNRPPEQVAKDAAEQAGEKAERPATKPAEPKAEAPVKTEEATPAPAKEPVKLSETDLDKEIEKALTEDLTK